MCPDHYAVVSSVASVLNQRLMRRVCRACAGTGGGSRRRTNHPARTVVLPDINGDAIDIETGLG